MRDPGLRAYKREQDELDAEDQLDGRVVWVHAAVACALLLLFGRCPSPMLLVVVCPVVLRTLLPCSFSHPSEAHPRPEKKPLAFVADPQQLLGAQAANSSGRIVMAPFVLSHQ